MIRRHLTRTKRDEHGATKYCRMKIELSDDGRLSLTGEVGYVVSPREAKAQALEYWRSYFEENPAEIIRLGRRTAGGAARHVLNVDGEYHGIDAREVGNKVFVGQLWGCCHDDIRRFFPEAAPFIKWHLNDMHSECEHQEARGETWQTHPNAVCPECGYKLGSAWLKREIPANVVEWAKTFLAGTTAEDA